MGDLDHRRTRIYVTAALGDGVEAPAEAGQAHKLRHVLRAREGDPVGLFNGRDGEWLARVRLSGRRDVVFTCERRIAAQAADPDLWLVFAPLKKARLDYMAQKAAEMGVSAVKPAITRRTVAERVNLDRLAANLIEGAEQCGRMSVPDASPPEPLDRLIGAWPQGRRLMFCDEEGAPPALEALAAFGRAGAAGPWAVLVGPEGGFDERERARIRAMAEAVPVSLGPRILRADTAAVAALAIWQAALGDGAGA